MGSPLPDVIPLRPAGIVRRAIATLIDMLVFAGLSVLLALPLARSVDWQVPVTYQYLVETVSNPDWLSHAAGIIGLWIAAWWLYFVLSWGKAGASPGKWLLGLRIVDYQQRCPIGVPRATLRLVAYTISSLTCCLGHLLVVVRKDCRALHDILAGTRVVHAHRERGFSRPPDVR